MCRVAANSLLGSGRSGRSDWNTPQGPKVWMEAVFGWRRLSTSPPRITIVSGGHLSDDVRPTQEKIDYSPELISPTERQEIKRNCSVARLLIIRLTLAHCLLCWDGAAGKIRKDLYDNWRYSAPPASVFPENINFFLFLCQDTENDVLSQSCHGIVPWTLPWTDSLLSAVHFTFTSITSLGGILNISLKILSRSICDPRITNNLTIAGCGPRCST